MNLLSAVSSITCRHMLNIDPLNTRDTFNVVKNVLKCVIARKSKIVNVCETDIRVSISVCVCV